MAVFERDTVAVITGAASGIGRAAAIRVAGAGMRIVLVDVIADKLARARDELAEIVGLANTDCE